MAFSGHSPKRLCSLTQAFSECFQGLEGLQIPQGVNANIIIPPFKMRNGAIERLSKWLTITQLVHYDSRSKSYVAWSQGPRS